MKKSLKILFFLLITMAPTAFVAYHLGYDDCRHDNFLKQREVESREVKIGIRLQDQTRWLEILRDDAEAALAASAEYMPDKDATKRELVGR